MNLWDKFTKGNKNIAEAADEGDIDLVKFLIKRGSDINLRGGRACTALSASTAHNYTELTKFLIENGADVNVRDLDGITPLINASYYGNVDIVKLLIKNGADVNAKTSNGITALINATGSVIDLSKLNIIKLLIKAGADVNAQTSSKGMTALINAANSHNFDAVKLLVENGANVNAKTHMGTTPLLNARTSGDKKIFDFLMANGVVDDLEIGVPKGAVLEPMHKGSKELIQRAVLSTEDELEGLFSLSPVMQKRKANAELVGKEKIKVNKNYTYYIGEDQRVWRVKKEDTVKQFLPLYKNKDTVYLKTDKDYSIKRERVSKEKIIRDKSARYLYFISKAGYVTRA